MIIRCWSERDQHYIQTDQALYRLLPGIYADDSPLIEFVRWQMNDFTEANDGDSCSRRSNGTKRTGATSQAEERA